MKPLQIIGCGPGSRSTLTLGGLEATLACDCLLGAPHLLALFPEFTGPRHNCPAHSREAIEQITSLRSQHARIAILVSGDTGLYSLATPVRKHFGALACEFHPGISSVQLACARLGISWENALILSAHASIPTHDLSDFGTHPLIIVLAGTPGALQWCAQLHRVLGNCYTATACSQLGLPEENILPISEWNPISLPSRTLVIFQRENTP